MTPAPAGRPPCSLRVQRHLHFTEVSPADANNALFMGRGGTKGTDVVKVN